jgi:hypothetical protein
MNKQTADYEQLRTILEDELDRSVSLEEATGIGNHLINVYDILLYNRGKYDTIEVDTTNQ